MGFGPDSLKHFSEHFWRLRSRDPVLLVNGEEGYPLYPEGFCPLLVRPHLIGIAITVQHSACFLHIDVNLRDELHERLGIAQRSSFGEVGVEEPFFRFLLSFSHL